MVYLSIVLIALLIFVDAVASVRLLRVLTNPGKENTDERKKTGIFLIVGINAAYILLIFAIIVLCINLVR